MIPLLVGLALADPALDPGAALPPAARPHYSAALSAESEEQWLHAEASYRLVLATDPTFAPAIVGLGRTLAEQGEVAEAIEVLEQLPGDPDAVGTLALVAEQADPARAMALYRRLEALTPDDSGPWMHEARLLASTDALAAAAALDTYLELSSLDGDPPNGAVVLSVAVALRNSGERDEAVVLLNSYLRDWPSTAAADEARGRLERWAVEAEAEQLASGGSVPLSAEQRSRVDSARRRAAKGDLVGAQLQLMAVVEEARHSDEAWGALGDIFRAQGAVVDAERAYAWSVALSPDESAWHARLGMLLADAYGGRRHSEAIEELQRATALRPDWDQTLCHLGRLHQEQGNWKEAQETWQACLDADPSPDLAEQARQHLLALSRPVPEAPQVTGAGGVPAGVPAEAWEAYRVALVYASEGDTRRAREELGTALALAPTWPSALNLLGKLHLREGDETAAMDAWNRSLEVAPEQPNERLMLGDLYRKRGDRRKARALLRRAAADGAAEAHALLATMAYEDGLPGLFEADRELHRYFESSSGGVSHEGALLLQAKVNEKMRWVRRVGGAGGALLATLALGSWIRRRTGKPLARLLERAPESAHEVARVLSAIRHEVLKHNTTLLPEIADAVDNGDHHAVRWGTIKLLGHQGEPGVVDRFDDYLAQLERLGARHGVRLDLRRHDPVLAPMHRSMARIRQLRPALMRPGRAPRHLSPELRALGVQLNETGYVQLGTLLQRMNALLITPELLTQVDERVRAEPSLSGEDLPDLEVVAEQGDLMARVLPGDLEDIMANLLRNAYRALVEHVPPDERHIGVVLDEEVDMVTGLEHVVLRVRDTAPNTLDDALIRTRQLGRGLGLMSDLVARHDGSVSVELEPGWSKAVVVRLPRAELATEASP